MNHTAALDALEQGYLFAKDGQLPLLGALGLAPAEDTGAVGLDSVDAGGQGTASPVSVMAERRLILIWNTPTRWVWLQFNTTADLYQHLPAGAAWLEEARQQVMIPEAASYHPRLVRPSIGHHEFFRGALAGYLYGRTNGR